MFRKENRVDVFLTFFYFLLLTSIALSIISPLIAFYYSLTLLVIFPKEFSYKYMRVYVSLIAIVNACIVFSSRAYLQSISDDFSHYYESYLSLTNGGSIAQYAGGIEFLISFYFKILIFIFGNMSVPHIFFCVSFFCSIVFYIWVEKFGLKNIDDYKKSLCVASCLAFFMYLLSTQLMRQMIATPFLLFALSYGLKHYKGKLFMIMAVGGHLSSIPLYFVLKTFLGNEKKKQWIILIIFIFFSLLFTVLLSHLSIFFNIPIIGELAAKLQYYNNITLRSGGDDKGNTFIKYMIVMLAGFVFFGPKGEWEYKKLFYLSCIAYILLLPIPLLSSRVFLMMSGVALGYFMFLAFYRISMIYRGLIIAYFIVRVLTLGPYYDFKGDGFDLWYSYPWISYDLVYFSK